MLLLLLLPPSLLPSPESQLQRESEEELRKIVRGRVEEESQSRKRCHLQLSLLRISFLGAASVLLAWLSSVTCGHSLVQGN